MAAETSPAYRFFAGAIQRQDVAGGRWTPLDEAEANSTLRDLMQSADHWQSYLANSIAAGAGEKNRSRRTIIRMVNGIRTRVPDEA